MGNDKSEAKLSRGAEQLGLLSYFLPEGGIRMQLRNAVL
jgi:hypothetical protein